MAEELEKKGNAAFVDEDFEEAVNLYTKALDLDSTNASVYISRAAAHVKLENFTGTYAWRGSSRTAHGGNPRKIEHGRVFGLMIDFLDCSSSSYRSLHGKLSLDRYLASVGTGILRSNPT